ncbi:hypothetical protein LG943_24725 [Streptomonospora sp. S1-112]|uniref:Uncharacterized protein n=1 Tax=Streptomonospora mangrovi TaxID=2883123 RepID=A0A9X3P0B0_9ACTN|nr:hypothetical protein [Streptomonospora mangrovi]MDA0567501.1 hypothetical protein [Streptomonospora mangrovi]
MYIHSTEGDYHTMLSPTLGQVSDVLRGKYTDARKGYQAAARELRKAAGPVVERLAELKGIVGRLPDTPLSDADGSRAAAEGLRALLREGGRLADEGAFHEPGMWAYSTDPPRTAAERAEMGADLYVRRTAMVEERTANVNAFAGKLATTVAEYREREAARLAVRGDAAVRSGHAESALSASGAGAGRGAGVDLHCRSEAEYFQHLLPVLGRVSPTTEAYVLERRDAYQAAVKDMRKEVGDLRKKAHEFAALVVTAESRGDAEVARRMRPWLDKAMAEVNSTEYHEPGYWRFGGVTADHEPGGAREARELAAQGVLQYEGRTADVKRQTAKGRSMADNLDRVTASYLRQTAALHDSPGKRARRSARRRKMLSAARQQPPSSGAGRGRTA